MYSTPFTLPQCMRVIRFLVSFIVTFLACIYYRFCTSGLPSDIVVEVGEMSFHLHKVYLSYLFHDV